MRDLAPDVFRQRMIIEGTTKEPISPEDMKNLLNKLCFVLNMVALTKPTLNYCEEYGWCAHMHWVTSGIHMYTWNNREPPFFSIDLYTCKPFNTVIATNSIYDFFGSKIIDLSWKEI